MTAAVLGGLFLLGALTLCTACGGSGTNGRRTTSASAAARTRHFAFGTQHRQSLAVSLGFDVLDIAGSHTDPTATKRVVDGLPPGTQALVWVGNLDNTDCTPTYADASFEALVDALAGDPRVFGYYLADEPHPARCPRAASDIRARADYVHARSSVQRAFIVVQDGAGECGAALGCEFAALTPAKTHVDLVGLDPYPCHYDRRGRPAPCDDRLIGARVAAAIAHGIDPARIVPVFQAFGQQGRVGGNAYYRTPTPAELEQILRTWDGLLPHPRLDATYAFGTQCSTTCPAPEALVNLAELRRVIQGHNR